MLLLKDAYFLLVFHHLKKQLRRGYVKQARDGKDRITRLYDIVEQFGSLLSQRIFYAYEAAAEKSRRFYVDLRENEVDAILLVTLTKFDMLHIFILYQIILI